MPSTTAPPTSGPNAIARPPIPPQAPRASPRRSGATAALSNVRVSGITIAPPSPCAARAAFSASTDGASAAPTDPRVKTASPIVNMRRRPNRSPSAAPVSRKTAKVSVYAFTVHSSCSSDASRSVRITGSAVVTTRLSSETMNSATEVIANVQSVRALPVIGDPPRSSVVISHSQMWANGRGHDASASRAAARRSGPMQPSIRRRAHGSRVFQRSIAAATLRSIPWANQFATAA